MRVQWSRQDEHGWDPKGPQQLLDLRAGLDAGRITAWQTEMWIPANRRGARILLAADAAGIRRTAAATPPRIYENGDPSYAVDHVRVVAHWLRDTPLNPSNLRAPGKPGNVFAVEGFTDEIAAATGADPLAFRLQRLTDPRALEVIKRGARHSAGTRGRHRTRSASDGLAARRPRHGLRPLQAGRELRRDVHGGRRRSVARARSR